MNRCLVAITLFLIAALPALAQTVPLGPRFVLPYQTVIDGTGVPLPGAFLYFYASGTNSLLTTYSDPLLTTPNSNPVIANASGVFPNIFLSGNYKVVLTDSSNNQIWTADPVYGVGTASGGTCSGGVNAQTGTSYTLQASDNCKLVTLSNAAAIAVALPSPTINATFQQWNATVSAIGGGAVTVTPVGASFTGTGSGTNLTVSAVTGTLARGFLVSGTGVSAGTTLVSQSSGTPGGAGVYVTSQATTSSGAALTAAAAISGQSSLPIAAGTAAWIVSDGANYQVVPIGSGGGGGGGSPGGSIGAVQYKAGSSTFGGTSIVANSVVLGGGTPSESTALPNGITGTTQAAMDASQLLATDQFVANALVGAGLVTSVFGRAGAITATAGDYTCSLVTGALCAANNLSDVANAGTARTNLGLGTAAIANTGTSGATVPLLNASNTFGGTQTFGTLAATSENITTTFQFAGNTMTFPGVPASLAWTVGLPVTPGHCVQFASAGSGGASGALSDAGAACGSGGGGGGSTANNQTFVAGVNYTPGVTTTLTLSSLPATQAALYIYEDGVAQPAPSQWTVNLTTGVVTFTNPIQAQNNVYATWLSTSLISGTVTSVSVATANGLSGTVANPTTTPSITLSTPISGILQGNGTAISAAATTGSGNVVLATSPTIASPTFSGTVGGANTIPLSVLAQSIANTMLGNWTAAPANVVANAMPSCPDNAGNHLNYVSGTGITCGTGQGNSITALTGDVAATGPGSATATIANNAVTYAKFQQVAANSLVGNATGSLANAEAISIGSTLTFSGTALQTTALSGDVTSSANSFATTLASNAVTYAKFQQVTASRLLGNPTGALANASEITLGSTLAFSAGALQTSAITGDVTSSANSFSTVVGKIQTIAVKSGTPTDGQVLTYVAANSDWEPIAAPAGNVPTGGTAGQVLAKIDATNFNTQWITVSGSGTVTSITQGSGLTFSTTPCTTTCTISLTVPVIAGNGGTGNTSNTAHGVMIGEGSSNLGVTAAGTAGQPLLSGGASADPSYGGQELIRTARRTITSGSSDTATAADFLILWYKTVGSASTENIPACASGIDGKMYAIVDEKGDAGANNITVTPATGTILGTTSLIMNVNLSSVTLQCDGTQTNWVVE